jgi:hypothetical protein
MKKFVVTKIEITDQEKYDKCEDPIKVGDIYNISGHHHVWRSLDVDEYGYKVTFENQTDDEFRSKNWRFEVDVIYPEGSGKENESYLFYDEVEFTRATSQVSGIENTETRYTITEVFDFQEEMEYAKWHKTMREFWKRQFEREEKGGKFNYHG